MRSYLYQEVKVDTPFGEYANPSFESQVETLSKARPGVPVMSVEAQVEELYGDAPLNHFSFAMKDLILSLVTPSFMCSS